MWGSTTRRTPFQGFTGLGDRLGQLCFGAPPPSPKWPRGNSDHSLLEEAMFSTRALFLDEVEIEVETLRRLSAIGHPMPVSEHGHAVNGIFAHVYDRWSRTGMS